MDGDGEGATVLAVGARGRRVEHRIRAATEEEGQADPLARRRRDDAVLAGGVVVSRQPAERVTHHREHDDRAVIARLHLLNRDPQPVGSAEGVQAR